MDLIKLKDPAEFQIPGVDIMVEREDNTIKRIVFDSGGTLFVISGNIYGNALEIYKPRPPEMVLRHRLTGTFLSVFPVNKLFTEKYEAEQAMGELMSAGATDCAIKEVMVEASKAVEPSQTVDIPF